MKAGSLPNLLLISASHGAQDVLPSRLHSLTEGITVRVACRFKPAGSRRRSETGKGCCVDMPALSELEHAAQHSLLLLRLGPFDSRRIQGSTAASRLDGWGIDSAVLSRAMPM